MNLSFVSNAETARTNKEAAFKRAENLAILGASHVLELCVGPSLETLEQAYNRFGIKVTGNDIEPRWRNYYPQGRWLMGNALKQDYSQYDSIVFAPPLSKGCTGKREDSLSINKISPGYYNFLANVIKQGYSGNVVLVLPARCLSTKFDRQQLYKLLMKIHKDKFTFSLIELKCGRRKIRKYVDLYLSKREF